MLHSIHADFRLLLHDEWSKMSLCQAKILSIPQQEPLKCAIVPVLCYNLFLRITTVQFLDVCACSVALG